MACFEICKDLFFCWLVGFVYCEIKLERAEENITIATEIPVEGQNNSSKTAFIWTLSVKNPKHLYHVAQFIAEKKEN